MPHKADKDFFREKREWSKRKDSILDFYLKPYLAKISHLRRPILLVDGFAGKGRFDDNLEGSPLIICRHAQVAISRNSDVKVLCIESDPALCASLKENLKPFEFAEARCSDFLSCIPEIEKLIASHSIFLYLDPFATEGLQWEALDRIFSHMQDSNASIEILLNFNVVAFVRRGLSALKRIVPEPNPEIEDVEQIESLPDDALPLEKVNSIVGGEWWIEIVSREEKFSDQVLGVSDGFVEKLATRFPQVCKVSIKKEDHHHVPAYYMVFASRSPDALLLMNDAMFQAKHNSLLTMDLLAPAELRTLIFGSTENWITRKDLFVAIVKKEFCRFEETEIRRYIADLVAEGQLDRDPVSGRMNDETKLRRANTLF